MAERSTVWRLQPRQTPTPPGTTISLTKYYQMGKAPTWTSMTWKKIEVIPEERRHRLLSLLKSRLISRAWEIAGRRYDDTKLVKKSASALLSNGDLANSPEFWNYRTSGGGSLLSGISNSLYPLYFTVKQLNEVMSTEHPCDFAYEFGDGLWDLPDWPQNFPKPAKHPWPLNDQVVLYVCHVGRGVMVGQAWQEGETLQQVPRKLCGEILMVKDYFPNPK